VTMLLVLVVGFGAVADPVGRGTGSLGQPLRPPSGYRSARMWSLSPPTAARSSIATATSWPSPCRRRPFGPTPISSRIRLPQHKRWPVHWAWPRPHCRTVSPVRSISSTWLGALTDVTAATVKRSISREFFSSPSQSASVRTARWPRLCSVWTGTDNEGLSGLEVAYDKSLTGKPGRLVVEQDPSGRDIPVAPTSCNRRPAVQTLCSPLTAHSNTKTEQDLSGRDPKGQGQGRHGRRHGHPDRRDPGHGQSGRRPQRWTATTSALEWGRHDGLRAGLDQQASSPGRLRSRPGWPSRAIPSPYRTP